MRTGNGALGLSGLKLKAVYPRAYGERSVDVQGGKDRRGLSPCVRGTAPWVPMSCLSAGFIPVRTGNGAERAGAGTGQAVYPRAYGERTDYPNNGIAQRGLSPCVRGTVNAVKRGIGGKRFIPVRTGNGSLPRARTWIMSVYPRAYGERQSSLPSLDSRSGLSPCVRGTGSRRPARR